MKNNKKICWHKIKDLKKVKNGGLKDTMRQEEEK